MPVVVNPFQFVSPGSQTFTTSGTFTVPEYNRLEVAVWGGGANGGQTDGEYDGTNGNFSQFGSPTAVRGNGGTGGGYAFPFQNNGAGGAGGTATGGDTNQTGGSGGNGTTISGSGGAAPSGTGTLLGVLTGGAGGAGRSTSGVGSDGNAPGGGAAGNKDGTYDAGGGGAGGLAIKLWLISDIGAPSPGSSVTVTVGSMPGGWQDNRGARGEVRVQWD